MEGSKSKVTEFQAIITKMSLEACCVTALPELGVRWRDVARAVRNARLPMTTASVGRVLARHVARDLPADELAGIVARLKLKLVATQSRVWHVINLLEPISEEPVEVDAIPWHVQQAWKKTRNGKNLALEVQVSPMGDLVYVSVCVPRRGAALYAAAPRGLPVLLVSAPRSALLAALVEGLGYQKHEDASLCGRDAPSLLRVANGAHTAPAALLAGAPPPRAFPRRAPGGLDYTGAALDAEYARALLGPRPPLLTDLTVRSCRAFFDARRLNKKINLTLELRSEDLAATLTAWASVGALAPTSDLFHIFHKIKSNKITFNDDDEIIDK